MRNENWADVHVLFDRFFIFQKKIIAIFKMVGPTNRF